MENKNNSLKGHIHIEDYIFISVFELKITEDLLTYANTKSPENFKKVNKTIAAYIDLRNQIDISILDELKILKNYCKELNEKNKNG